MSYPNRSMYDIIYTLGNTYSRIFFVKRLCLSDTSASPLAPVPAHITPRFQVLHPDRDSSGVGSRPLLLTNPSFSPHNDTLHGGVDELDKHPSKCMVESSIQRVLTASPSFVITCSQLQTTTKTKNRHLLPHISMAHIFPLPFLENTAPATGVCLSLGSASSSSR